MRESRSSDLLFGLGRIQEKDSVPTEKRGSGDNMIATISLFTTTLSPAAGGLAASIPPLAHRLARSGAAEVHVVGLEDPDDPAAARAWGPMVHAHQSRGPSALAYAPQMAQTLERLAPDVIDVQGLWTYPSLVNLRHHHRYSTPYIVTPRGMLDPWARMRSRWKKRAVQLWFEDEHLARAACLRATAEMEAEHFRAMGLRNPIAIVPNGVDVPDELPSRSTAERRRVLFLSRIHPKKGLPYLLRAWARLEPSYPDWDLIIAGPDEVGHTADMKRLSQNLKLRNVQFQAAVYGAHKSAMYRSADVFVLPTHAENFGLVIAEALAHEVPVITTRHAPWQGLRGHRCGWWIDLDEDQLFTALSEAMAQPRTELNAMGARGRAWMQRDFSWDHVAESMLEVYDAIAHQKPLPEHLRYDSPT
ncbi:MAG: glycosyltransferase [Balneolaceae bacterium]|nr:glycosyltransferase [Balneolaceae bacterium]